MVGRLWLYQRIIVVRRQPSLMDSDDRQSTARCSTYCIVHPSHHDCSSLDALSAPKTRARRLLDNLRRYRDRLGTWMTIPYCLRRFQKVAQTSLALAKDSKTV
ncbi:hypothetical protein DPMN_067890 [Dreissena polymorpha]|uniref:Uncharacterized protein n=1 Tax=Dreissena polymorpha TaxID=45954 RepID=A0A9D4BTT0_DREPO|nr:hypothetical protein DPMN_067890 [Dreissena polymorpha]